MRGALRRTARGRQLAATLLAASAMLLSSLVVGAEGAGRSPGPSELSGRAAEASLGASARFTPAELAQLPLLPISHGVATLPHPGDLPITTAGSSSVTAWIALPLSNATRLGALLASLQNRSSPEYHHYLTASAFSAEFAPAAVDYATLVAYLSSFPDSQLTQFPDRLGVTLRAPATTLGAIFHSTLALYQGTGARYWAFSSEPALPRPLAALVSEIAGFGPSVLTARADAALSRSALTSEASPNPLIVPGYLAPVTLSGVQYLYPSDLQYGYDEESLLQEYGPPVGEDVAALVWDGTYAGPTTSTACGTLGSGAAVGPYDPNDTASFFANTLPSGQPTPTFVDVQVGGGPRANCQAAYDSTGVVASTTAEIEAIGSLAPGSTVYAVATAAPTVAELDSAMQTILSPPTTLPAQVRSGLANVSVVDAGWSSVDSADNAWTTDMEAAAARGISVVAPTGDSSDDPSSVAWIGTDASFPASVAASSYGVLAVGGTTLTLNSATLHVQREIAWNVSAKDTKDGGPLGTAGGISGFHLEPSFQRTTEANTVINGAGRGVPDLAAVANNTLITLTVNATQYRAENATDGGPFRAAHGTAIAAAVIAGELAEVDHVLRSTAQPALGYPDPTLYALAQAQFTLPSGSGLKLEVLGTYAYGLPTSPFRDVLLGSNSHYAAAVGYDLVTGWGSLDAYNLTMYLVPAPTGDVYGALGGIQDQVRLSSLAVTTYSGGVVEKPYNATIQQSFFLANSLGAPVYFVQSVVYLHHSGSGWTMNFTGWLTYPFWPIYPRLNVTEYRWPAVGEVESLPLTVTLTTMLQPAKGSTPPTLKFTYGVPGSPILDLNAPGAAYIVGQTGYRYSWQGTTYTDGPAGGGRSAVGFLDPQLALVGGPPAGVGVFGTRTNGSVTATIEPVNSLTFVAARTGRVNASNSVVAETADGLGYSGVGGSLVNFAYAAGATQDGIFLFQAPWYAVVFNETGVPGGADWFVNVSSGAALEANGTVTTASVSLPNGSYSWTSAVSVRNWSSVPASGSVVVAGGATFVTLVYGPSSGRVTFVAKGPVHNGQLAFPWWVNITGEPPHSQTATNYIVNLPFGTYAYKIASTEKGYRPSKGKGTFVIGRNPVSIDVTFSQATYLVDFVFELPKSPPRMTIELAGYSQTGSFPNWGLVEPNGTYSWRVSVPLGYLAEPASGSITVHGKVHPITIRITEPGWGPFGLGVVGYAIVAGAPALVAIWMAVVLYRRRRVRRAAEEPTEEEEEPPRRRRRRAREAPAPRRSRDLSPDEL